MATIASLIVRIGARTEEIESALGKVGLRSKELDSELKKLGNTPLAQATQKSLEELNKSLKSVTDSQQKVATQGVRAAQGIEAIGGPARLTRTELERINKTLDASLDAFRALGQEAPKDLQRVAAAVKAQRQELEQQGKGGLLQQAQGALGALGISTQALTGAGLATALVAGAKAAATYADALTKLHDRTGISTTSLQRLDAVARASGNTVEEVANAVNLFQRRLAAGDADQVIARIGLSVTQLRQLDPDDQFFAIAKAIAAIEDPAERTRAAMDAFGRSGAQLLPTLTANIDGLKDSTVRLSEDAIKTLDAFGDELGRLKGSAVAVLGEIAASGITLLKILGDLPGAIRKAREEADRDREDPNKQKTLFGLGPTLPKPLPFGSLVPNVPASQLTAAQRAALVEGTGAQLPKSLGLKLPEPLKSGEQLINPDDLAAITRELDRQREAFNLTHAEEIKYLEALKQVNAKLREAQRPIQTLTEEQQSLFLSYRALGLSNEEIAIKFNLSAGSVHAYEQELEGLGARLTSQRRDTDQARESIGRLDLGYVKATNASGLLRKSQLALSNSFQTTDGAVHDLAAEFGTLATTLADGRLTVPDFLRSTDTISKFNKHLLTLSDFGDRASGTMRKFRDETDKAADQAERAELGVDDLARALAQMAQVSDGAFGGLVRDLAQVVTALDAAQKAAKAFETAQTKTGKAAAAAGGAAAFLTATGTGKPVSSALGGALTGAAIGSIVPGIGTAVGAVAGALVGLLRGLGKSEAEKVAFDIGRDLGIQITEGLAKQIEADSKRLGSRFAAIQKNLSAVIQEAGGVEVFGVDRAISEARDLFSLIQTGELSIQEAGKAFNDVFGQIAPAAINKTTGLASKAFSELISLSRGQGGGTPLESQQVTQFVQGQITTNVVGGLTRFLNAGNTAAEKFAASQQRLIELNRELATASTSEQDKIRSEIAKTTQELTRQEAVLKVVTITSQGSATAVGSSVAAAFGELQRQGVPILDILEQLDPVINGVTTQLARAGFGGGEAFDTIRQFAVLAKDEIAGPAFQAVSGLGQALAGLSNTGLLTQDTFAGLSGQVASTFNTLVAQGVNGEQALRLMQPTLQTLFSLQKDFGFAVDTGTQELLDQAEAAGIVGDKFRTSQQQIVDALGRTNDILAAIADQLGAKLPEAARRGAAGVAQAVDKIPKDFVIDVEFNVEEPPDIRLPGIEVPEVSIPIATGGLIRAQGVQHFARGGMVDEDQPQYLAGGGKARVIAFRPRGTDTVPAMLTPGEVVLNKTQQEQFAELFSSVTNTRTTFSSLLQTVTGAATGGQVTRDGVQHFAFGGQAIARPVRGIDPSPEPAVIISRAQQQSITNVLTTTQQTVLQITNSLAKMVAETTTLQGGVQTVGPVFTATQQSFTDVQATGTDAVASILALLEQLKAVLVSQLPAAAQQSAQGVTQALNSIPSEKTFTIKINAPDILANPPEFRLFSNSVQTFAQGGAVDQPWKKKPQQAMASGGVVPAGGVSDVTLIPYAPRGTDTVPALLTPGEFVLTKTQQTQVAQAWSAVTQQPMTFSRVLQFIQHGGTDRRTQTSSVSSSHVQHFAQGGDVQKDVSRVLNVQHFATGGDVQPWTKEPHAMAVGGLVPSQGIAQTTLIPFTPKGTDTVPAMLTPGELVLTKTQAEVFERLKPVLLTNSIQHFAEGGRVLPFARATSQLMPTPLGFSADQRQALSEGVGGSAVLNVTIQAMDAASFKQFAERHPQVISRVAMQGVENGGTSMGKFRRLVKQAS